VEKCGGKSEKMWWVQIEIKRWGIFVFRWKVF